MSGCHLPLLYIGMEYVATNNVAMAQQHFTQAHAIAARDPAVLHELGVVAFRTGRHEAAAAFFSRGLTLTRVEPGNMAQSAAALEVTLSNLARVQVTVVNRSLSYLFTRVACVISLFALSFSLFLFLFLFLCLML